MMPFLLSVSSVSGEEYGIGDECWNAVHVACIFLTTSQVVDILMEGFAFFQERFTTSRDPLSLKQLD